MIRPIPFVSSRQRTVTGSWFFFLFEIAEWGLFITTRIGCSSDVCEPGAHASSQSIALDYAGVMHADPAAMVVDVLAIELEPRLERQ